MGDLIAKVGKKKDIKCGIGKFGLGERGERGDSLPEFSHANNLAIAKIPSEMYIPGNH